MSEAQLKKEMYVAHATSVGGRGGHVENSDKVVSVNLAPPKSMGGTGLPGTTTPEDLFAAGYAACFGSACDFVAKNMLKLNPTKITIASSVANGEDVAGGFGLKVVLTAKIEGLSPAETKSLISKAHEICPYSKAIRGNVHVELKS